MIARRELLAMGAMLGTMLACEQSTEADIKKDRPKRKDPKDPKDPKGDRDRKAGGASDATQAGLRDPSKAKERAPDTFKVKFATTKGDFVIEVNRSWSPNGADRFYKLVKSGFYSDICIFRVVKGFMAQFGISGDPAVSKLWSRNSIKDDPPQKEHSNLRGMVTFAKTGAPNSRSTQLFINYKDNSRLDRMGFTPIGRIVKGMEVVDALEGKYGEKASKYQGKITSQGNSFLKERFPDLDYILSATLV